MRVVFSFSFFGSQVTGWLLPRKRHVKGLTCRPPTEKIPASQLFDAINDQLAENPAEVKEAIKKGNGIFAFTIKGKSGVTDSWHVDLKSTGRVGKGIGEKPDGKTGC